MCRQALYQAERRLGLRQGQFSEVEQMVRELRMQMPRLGTRKLYFLLRDQLVAQHIKVGRDGLFALLRTRGLLIRPRKSYHKTTQSKHWLRRHPNLLKSTRVERPEQVWVSDITYVVAGNQPAYLSLITDAYSRKIIGYHLSEDLRTEGTLRALAMALKQRRTTLPLLHHSDRGLQYCSMPYQRLLQKNHITPSMTEGSTDCYQNALAERINGILKDELLPEKVGCLKDLREAVKQSIYIYNNKRPHLNLKFNTPAQIHQQAIMKLTENNYLN